MSARMEKQRASDDRDLRSSTLDELDEYIRYQDEVLDRNSQELRGVVEEQEEMMRLQQVNQDHRLQKLYEKKDALDQIDERLQKLIQRTDDKMGQRMAAMDKKTDDYMEDLAKRNAQWSYRLKEVGKNITRSARTKGEVVFEERQEQKEINRHYRPTHTHREAGGDVVWDAETVVDKKGTRVRGGTVVEVMSPEEQLLFAKQERQRIKRQAKAKKPAPKKKRPQQTQRKTVPKKSRPEYKIGTSQGRKPGTQTKRKEPVKKAGPKSYPCPTCENSLVFYDKYQRWWCRSCKKWR